jgi:hypothetical protein
MCQREAKTPAVKRAPDQQYSERTGKNSGGNMNRFRLELVAVLTAILSVGLSFSPALLAQSKSTTASLSGTVTDPSGARVPNATVKLSNRELAVTRAGTTNAAGEFAFAFLPEGLGIQDHPAGRDHARRRRFGI